MICALILAAGESKRMGKQKLLLPFGRKTIIERIIENMKKSSVDETLVVLGADKEKIEEKIKRFSLKIAFNPDFQKGMLSSVLCGLSACPEKARAVMIVLGDQPSIPVSVVERLIRAYRKSGKGIILPVYKKNRGHPLLIDLKYRKEIENLSPEIGLRQLVYSHSDDVFEVKVKTSAILRDIDNFEDYESELKNN